MNLKNLAIFVDVARRGSFVAVAKNHNLDPATISRAIISLEEELELKLFQRTTRRIELTEAGAIYFERVEPLVEELNRAQLMAAETKSSPKGRLRISCPPSFAELNLVPLLTEFSAAYPDLSFDLILTDEDLDLIVNHIDIAVRIGSPPDSLLISYKLAQMITYVCAAPAYLDKQGVPKTPIDLVGRNCLILAYRGFDDNEWRFRCRRTAKMKTVPIKDLLRTSNALALKNCALSGMGIALLAGWMIGRELRTGKLVNLFPDYDVTAAQGSAAAWLLYPSKKYVPAKVRIFVDFLKEAFKNGAPWDCDNSGRL